ncbi:hypothetical protein HPB52_018740 [Rhipicephalus sanguineus]|uniref:Uncharacterized protein n=1 Tax=Rhipicephalus sanguineus TaxID=34632 RepID=A0A9D4QFC4_RHISA|nr:hypothetical protein HPB52_018740 [Rhipicephalus sanguineus]
MTPLLPEAETSLHLRNSVTLPSRTSSLGYQERISPADIRNEKLREPLMQHPRLLAQAWDVQGGGHSLLSEVSVNELQIEESIILINDLHIPPAPPPDDIASDFITLVSEVNEAMATSKAEVTDSRQLAMQPEYPSNETGMVLLS